MARDAPLLLIDHHVGLQYRMVFQQQDIVILSLLLGAGDPMISASFVWKIYDSALKSMGTYCEGLYHLTGPIFNSRRLFSVSLFIKNRCRKKGLALLFEMLDLSNSPAVWVSMNDKVYTRICESRLGVVALAVNVSLHRCHRDKPLHI